ncbi:MAG: RNA polymerase sigma factor [Deltaproteobacteria bacterium]|nr:RNA polymerase sigma factor [Deltaproteobacteria bacterium]
MNAPPDEDCARMARVARGDTRAFAELFDRHQASVVRFATRFVGDAARGEELAQDIFVSLFRAAPRYQPTARFKTWLYRVATHHCLNARRGLAARASSVGSEPLAHVPADPSHSPHAVAEGRELAGVLSAGLAALPERERAAFTLSRFEGLSYREVAEALETSESAVKSLVHRATVALAGRVETHGRAA